MESAGLQRVMVGETGLAYRKTGAGQPVVFVHGIPTDYRAWDQQVETFSKRYSMVAYSRRLAAPNENKQDYAESTIENNSADLTGLIEQVSTSPVHLIGHSYGGFTAAYCAAAHPEIIRSLVLIEPAVSTMLLKNRKSPVQLLKLLLTSPSTAMSAASFQRNSLDPCLAAFNRGDYESALRLNVDGIMNRKNALDQLPETVQRMMKENEKTVGELIAEPPIFDKDAAAKIAAPTLLIHGTESPKVLHSIVERLAKAIPKSEVAKVSGSAHFPHFEKPDEFNGLVLGFLDRHA